MRRVYAWLLVIMLAFAFPGAGGIAFASNSSSTGPSLAYNSTDDNYLMVYSSDTGGGTYEIVGQFLTGNGATSGSEFVISNEADQNTGAPEVLFNDETDRFFVVWQDGSGSSVQVVASILDSDGSVLTDDFLVDEDGSVHQLQPQIARNPTADIVLIVWLDASSLSDTEFKLVGALYDESDSSITSIEISTKKTNVNSHDVSYSASSEEFAVVWDSQHNPSKSRLTTEYIDANGNLESGVSYLSPGQKAVTNPSITYSETANDNLVAWVDVEDDVYNVYTQGVTSGSAINVFSAEPGVEITDITIASQGSSDELLLVWTEFDGENYSVLGNYVNDDGSATGAENIVIVAASSDPVEPILAFNPEDDSFLIMQDDGSGVPTPADGGGSSGPSYGDLEFSTSASSTSEDGSVSVTVERNNGSDEQVTVSYATSNGSADSDDFIAKSGTLTFSDGESSETITVLIIEDDIDEPDESFTITLSSPTGGADLGSTTAHTVTILDDDDPNGEFNFALSSETVLEGEDVTLVVNREAGQNGLVSVDYVISLGTASTNDLTVASGTLSFTDGQTSKSIIVSTIEDQDTEDDETFDVVLSSPTNGSTLGTTSSTTVTIIDNDQKTEAISFAESSKSVTEGNQVTLRVNRQGSLEGEVTVDYSTQVDSASQLDFTSASGTLTFADSESQKSIMIDTIDDGELEATEAFNVVLSNPTGTAYLGSIQSTSVEIEDNDSEANFSKSTGSVIEGQSYLATVNRTGDKSSSSSVDYTVALGSASGADIEVASGTITFVAGDSSEKITITTNEDNEVESDETFTISLSNPSGNLSVGSISSHTVTISDNDFESETFNFKASSVDIEEGTIVQLTVVRSGSLNGSSTVDYAVSYGTATSDDVVYSDGTLSFGDSISSMTISIEAVDDALIEDTETLTLTLSNPSGSGSLGELTTLNVNLTDNDSQVEFESTATSVIEGGSKNLTVVRTGDLSESGTVDYTTIAGTASGSDYASASGTLTFSEGVNKATIAVATSEDAITEETEQFTVVLSNPSGSIILGSNTTATISIIDDDQITDAVTFMTDAEEVDEGESLVVDVYRSGSLSGSLTIDFTTAVGTAGSTDFTFGSGTLTFADGDDTESITIDTIEDIVIESDEVFTLVLANPSPGSELGSISELSVTILDEDREVEFASATGSVVEGQSYSVTVTRTGDVAFADSVYYTIEADSAGETDYSDDSGTVTFTSGEKTKTIQVATIDDILIEDTETFTIVLSNVSSGATLGDQRSHTVSILENDVNVDTFNFTTASSSLSEGDQTTLTVLRSGSLEGSISVDYRVVQETADSTDYTLDSGTITFLDGESEQMITINTIEDSTVESEETFTIQLENPTGLSRVGSVDTVEVTIEDDDSEIELLSSEYTITEGEEITVTLTRTGDLSTATSVDYTLVSDSADASDYTAVSGTIEFDVGESTQTITVQTIEDTITESAETFTIVLSNPIGDATLGTTTETSISISDDDSISTTFNLSSGSEIVSEGDSEQVTVIRTGSLEGTDTVAYSLTAGTADTSDYVIAAGILEFADGEIMKIITIETVEDSIVEDIEYFTLKLVNPSSGAEIGSIDDTRITIFDDDKNEDEVSFDSGIETVEEGESLVLTVERTGDFESEATIDYLVTSGTTDSSDYDKTAGTVTFEEGESSIEIEIPIILDDKEEGAEFFYVLLHNPSSGLTVGDVATVIVVVENVTPTEEVEIDQRSEDIDESESASIVKSLTNVLKNKTFDEEGVSAQTVDAYYAHIDKNLAVIEDDETLREAVGSYVDAIGVLGNVDKEASPEAWLEAQIIERVNVFSESVVNLEDHEDLTAELIDVIQEIQEENMIESSALLDQAIEKMAEVTFADIGSIEDKYSTGVVDGKTEVTFNPLDIQNSIVEELEAFNELNTLVENYYGQDNVRDFDFEVKLVVPKLEDSMTVKLDKEILRVAEDNAVDSMAIEIGGTSLIFNQNEFKNGGDEHEDVVIGLEYKNEENEKIDKSLLEREEFSDEGYTVDVNVKVNGESKDRFEKPIKLKFDVEEFMFMHEDYNPDKLSVFRLDEETGEWEPVGGSYDPLTDSITVFRQNLSQYTVMQSNKSFNDIADSAVKDDIEELLGKGIIDETASFNPQENITREELATWVARSYGLEGDQELPFGDVDPNSDNYEELAGAYAAGVFSGTSENTFNPNGNVTKEEMAVMLANAMTQFDQKKLNQDLGGELASLSDSDLISDWAADELAMLSELGFIDDSGGTVNPDQQLSKEEAVSLLKKISG